MTSGKETEGKLTLLQLFSVCGDIGYGSGLSRHEMAGLGLVQINQNQALKGQEKPSRPGILNNI